ncbi:MAG: sigma-70 family RNA polymerase sigma factor [Victivallales bacterium]|nr:sigma-70 family RNA polymerase sigma factor [Victivallales bacterium]MBT7164026.1 sigma-70 family RNA polymerase sigma factor [Victivallales bacterium]
MLSDNDTMQLYMQKIGQYPLVTRQEEADLAAKIAAGDEAARAKLIRSNLRLVVKIAHDFKGFGLPLLDLISEGNIGLMRAVEKFDPTKGAKLSSYAAWWIKQSMRRGLANQARTIRIPVQSASKMSRIQAGRTKLTEELGREPTNKEIAEEVDLTERTVAGLRLGKPTTISLQDHIQHGEEGEFQDIIRDEKTVAPDTLAQNDETLRHMLALTDRLDERERTILTLRFGLAGERPQTLEVVSQTICRTRERVRQIQNQALEKLRVMFEEDGQASRSAGREARPAGRRDSRAREAWVGSKG